MNLLTNPSFQNKQRGGSFNLVPSGVYTLDRWVSISDVNSRCNIKQVSNPLGCEVEFNAAGFGGVWQPIEREELLSHVGKSRTFSVDVQKVTAGTMPLKLMVLAWGGTANKPTLSPVSNFASLGFSANWSLLASADFTATTAGDRYSVTVPTLPDAQNIAVMAVFQGVGGDYVVLRDASFGKTTDFDGVDWQADFRRCSWFFQHYPYEALMNCEWGVGRKDPGGFVSFQFPLSYPLRGAWGGAGVYDINVSWPVSPNGYWHYGDKAYSAFPGPPTMTCHHRHFVLFTSPSSIPNQSVTIFRHWQSQPGATITFDAELRP